MVANPKMRKRDKEIESQKCKISCFVKRYWFKGKVRKM